MSDQGVIPMTAASLSVQLILMVAVGLFAWRAQVQARELRDAAEAAARKGKGKKGKR